jgi:hypothetical protein
MQATPEMITGLADKLDGLDLTEAERTILDTVLERAASSGEPDVEGFGVFAKYDGLDGEFIDRTTFNPTADKLARGIIAIELDAG